MVNPAHRLAGKRSVDIKELTEEPIIVTKQPDILQEHTGGGGLGGADEVLLNKMLSTLRENLKPDIKLIELDMSTYDAEFSN